MSNYLIDELFSIPGYEINQQRRVKNTIACRDCDYIPKVHNAGKTFKLKDGKKCQLMHNGIKVLEDGYYGKWQTEIIRKLKGHHKPQEEKVFYEIFKDFNKDTAMIELGSYWSYYSLWFRQINKAKTTNICCEPNISNIEIGINNFKLNEYLDENVHFVNSAAGDKDGQKVSIDLGEGKFTKSTVRTVDSLVEEYKIKHLGLLHIDVQGAELKALRGAEKTIKKGILSYLFISTHHYLISRNPSIHEECLALIKKWGGNIVSEHEIHESYSGDGLIVASFLDKDKKLKINVSYHRMKNNQFRSYTEDLSCAFKIFDTTKAIESKRENRISELNLQIENNMEIINQLERSVEYLSKPNIKRATKSLIKSIYRSIKFRTVKLIWSDKRYKNSQDLLTYLENGQINASNVEGVLYSIIKNDSVNVSIIPKDSSLRVFVYEKVRSIYLYFRKIIRR